MAPPVATLSPAARDRLRISRFAEQDAPDHDPRASSPGPSLLRSRGTPPICAQACRPEPSVARPALSPRFRTATGTTGGPAVSRELPAERRDQRPQRNRQAASWQPSWLTRGSYTTANGASGSGLGGVVSKIMRYSGGCWAALAWSRPGLATIRRRPTQRQVPPRPMRSRPPEGSVARASRYDGSFGQDTALRGSASRERDHTHHVRRDAGVETQANKAVLRFPRAQKWGNFLKRSSLIAQWQRSSGSPHRPGRRTGQRRTSAASTSAAFAFKRVKQPVGGGSVSMPRQAARDWETARAAAPRRPSVASAPRWREPRKLDIPGNRTGCTARVPGWEPGRLHSYSRAIWRRHLRARFSVPNANYDSGADTAKSPVYSVCSRQGQSS